MQLTENLIISTSKLKAKSANLHTHVGLSVECANMVSLYTSTIDFIIALHCASAVLVGGCMYSPCMYNSHCKQEVYLYQSFLLNYIYSNFGTVLAPSKLLLTQLIITAKNR